MDHGPCWALSLGGTHFQSPVIREQEGPRGVLSSVPHPSLLAGMGGGPSQEALIGRRGLAAFSLSSERTFLFSQESRVEG